LTYHDVDKSISAITGEDFVKVSVIVKALNKVLAGTSLPVFAEKDMSSDADRLKVIRQWLLGNGMNESQAKDAIESTKNEIFDSLTAKDLEPDYLKLLEAIPLISK
jgi:hypothetical protein